MSTTHRTPAPTKTPAQTLAGLGDVGLRAEFRFATEEAAKGPNDEAAQKHWKLVAAEMDRRGLKLE